MKLINQLKSNKKGIFFSVLAILVSLLIVTFFSVNSEVPLDNDVDFINERISFMVEFN